MKKILISFVHGYRYDDIKIRREKLPCLITLDVKTGAPFGIHNLPFPRTPGDFFKEETSELIRGEPPLPRQKMEFKKLPRFGVMGMDQDSSMVYAATWNGVYEIQKDQMRVRSFLSHRLINDPHGICVSKGKLYSVLTALDLVVITEIKSGKILDYFSVDRNLKIVREPQILKYDWRFISKQHRGAVGNWHFNFVRVSGDKIYLTSRLTSSVLEVDYLSNNVALRTVCWDTPVMIHDGRLFKDGNLVFTSVDGKILIAKPAGKLKSGISSMSEKSFHKHMKRDLVNVSIRLGALLGREINWCRGIEDCDGDYITTLDGRYDQSRPFFNIAFVNKESKKVKCVKIPYSMVDFPEQIRYMTGFSVLKMT